MKHLIKVLFVLFALTLVMGKPIPDDSGVVQGNDNEAWSDEGHLISSAMLLWLTFCHNLFVSIL